MDKILSIQTIKNVFAALGAKTSNDNYGVALLDKTTAEPKGLMGMSDLASVLGGIARIKHESVNVGSGTGTNGLHYAVDNVISAGGAVMYFLTIQANALWNAIGFKNSEDYSVFILFSYSEIYLCSKEGAKWYDYTINKSI